MDVETSTSALLVLRFWTESGHRFRVRVTRGNEQGLDHASTYATSKDAVLIAVGDWLDDVAPEPPQQER